MRKRSEGKRWSEARARQELARWQRSGQSMNAYAKQRGYQAQRLSWWRTRLGGEAWAGSGAPAETITLAPAVITGSVRPAVVVSVDATAVTMEVLDAAAVPASWVAQVALGLRSMGAA